MTTEKSDSYKLKLRDPRWIEKREAIKKRDNHTCVFCGERERPLQVHHLKYKGNPWDIEDKYLVTLCDWCHETETFDRAHEEQKIIKHLREQGFSTIEVARIGALINRLNRANLEIKFPTLANILSSNHVQALYIDPTI